ncbi:(Fe-S)-binding protein [Ferroplasma sp.]|uniref:(Fe-S)-binding protein n=1 Tax=Ferroplasma sp. TaxID=2591003 RepID=UPI002609EEA8|nr:(Fe-S)-binding protein [Ferroplasma sp.]MCL4453058.1 (Fe-S)-binding protein [Candidatus Thermoplasmatota archaeon]
MDINKKRIEKMRDLIFQNLMDSYLPFPLDTKLYSSWANNIPNSGDTVIYTSYMYQISGILKRYEALFPKIYRLNIPKRLMTASKFLIKPKDEELQRAFRILKSITSMLSGSGVNFGYLYDQEPYSGALLLESGFIKEYKEYGEKLYSFFNSKGIKNIITVDPHTTNALKRYKDFIDFDIDVKNYLELVKFKGSGNYVIHDSCLYSRAMGMYSDIRNKVNNSGLSIDENYLITSKEMGSCCGGPLSLVSAQDSEEVSRARAEKLLSVNENVLVMCPLCYENLSPYINNIKDLAEVVS